VIIAAFKRALKDALEIIDEISLPVDIDDDKAMYQLISSSIGTKFVSRWSELMCSLALKAVRTVTHDVGGGKKEVDIKRYARVEKIPGGEIEDSKVLDGVMLNKDITHPKMRRRIENPRIILLDCPLEYKKGESQTNIEITKEEDWNKILEIEEEQVKLMCDAILALKPDLVITEKGVSGTSNNLESTGVMLTCSRSCATLPFEGQCNSSPPGPKNRQQQDSPSYWRHCCKPCGRPSRIGCRNQLWTLRNREDRRRILHLPHQM
jgi:chaperonin GroEL (HSP60 family)